MGCNNDEYANGKIANFAVKGEDLLSFCDCLSLVRNNIGLIAWGAEDLFTLFEEGSTAFYTATEESIIAAIEAIKLKINNPEEVDYAFFILVSPDEQLKQMTLDEIYASSSKCIPSREFYFQIYQREKTAVASPVSLPGKKFSYEPKDIATFGAYTTVYVLTNKR